MPDANGDMLKALERRLDLNGDGQIQYKEFAAWYVAEQIADSLPCPLLAP